MVSSPISLPRKKSEYSRASYSVDPMSVKFDHPNDQQVKQNYK